MADKSQKKTKPLAWYLAMFEPRDPDFEARVRASFAAQSAMKSLHIQLLSLQPGGVTMQLEKSDHLLQQQALCMAGC